MFWNKKPKEDTHLVPHREECNKIATAALAAARVDFDRESQLNQALVGTFVFGMISAHGMMHKLQPAEVHAVALCVFKDTLHYTDKAAVEGVHHCISATTPSYHPAMNAILHQGIDGHRQYLQSDAEALSKNIRSILERYAKKS